MEAGPLDRCRKGNGDAMYRHGICRDSFISNGQRHTYIITGITGLSQSPWSKVDPVG